MGKKKSGTKEGKAALSNPIAATEVSKESPENPPKSPPEDYDGSSDFAPYLWLLLFSILMFTLPFLAFYGTKHFLEPYKMDIFTQNCWCVGAAVFSAYFVIFLYILKAFHEDRDTNKKNL